MQAADVDVTRMEASAVAAAATSTAAAFTPHTSHVITSQTLRGTIDLAPPDIAAATDQWKQLFSLLPKTVVKPN